MALIKVKHNFAASQPRWTGIYISRFGQNNEGFIIPALDHETPREAFDRWNEAQLPGLRLNPFYVTLEYSAESLPDQNLRDHEARK